MKLNKDIISKRKEYLGLTEHNTKKVYDTIFDLYKNKIVEAPRKIVDYGIDIIICNMNYYNRLGKIEKLNETWGDDDLFIDFNNSTFVKLEVDDDGAIKIDNADNMQFNKLKELDDIKNTSFSLKELIDLCKKDNIEIKLFDGSIMTDTIGIEIIPSNEFTLNISLKRYLNKLEK